MHVALTYIRFGMRFAADKRQLVNLSLALNPREVEGL